jgi:myosin-5
VLEAVRISCAGYPTKLPFLDFIDHFWMLALDSPQQLDDVGFVRLVLNRVLGDEGWQIGLTKVGADKGGARGDGVLGHWTKHCWVVVVS